MPSAYTGYTQAAPIQAKPRDIRNSRLNQSVDLGARPQNNSFDQNIQNAYASPRQDQKKLLNLSNDAAYNQQRQVPDLRQGGAVSAQPSTIDLNAAQQRNRNTPQAASAKNWRSMPIHNKEEVFDEWGAIIRQQDEIDHEIDRLNKKQLRQINYKQELDKQMNEVNLRN